TGITRVLAAAAVTATLAGLSVAGAAAAEGAAPSHRGAAASPAGTRAATPVTAYVVNFLAGTVTPVNTATNTAGKAIKVGNGPSAIAITPDGKTAYIVNSG